MLYVEIDSTRLFYEISGSGEPHVVFVHGMTCDHSDWRLQVDYFSPDHTTVAIDLRGHGFSRSDPEHYEIGIFASDITSIIKKQNLNDTILVGHSMGCRAILQAYINEPELFSGLVLIDNSRSVEPSEPELARQIIRKRIRDQGYSNMIGAFFDDMFPEGSDPEIKRRIVKRALEFPEQIGVNLFETTVAWDAGTLDHALSNVRVPMLVIQSTYVTPERKRVTLIPGETTPWLDLVRHYQPGARIEIVSDTGHFTMLEAEHRVNDCIVEFVNRVQELE